MSIPLQINALGSERWRPFQRHGIALESFLNAEWQMMWPPAIDDFFTLAQQEKRREDALSPRRSLIQGTTNPAPWAVPMETQESG